MLVNTRSFENLSKELALTQRTLGIKIDDLKESVTPAKMSSDERRTLSALEKRQVSIEKAISAMSAETDNEIFDIPQSVSSCYIGRQDLLEELRLSLTQHAPRSHREQQWRFVIQGISGSGKTQFCSKFAQENQSRFWGVFKCNGSSENVLQQTLGDIAKQHAKLSPDADTALQWLSNVKKRWLLIIDSADDERVDLSKYFPNNSRGHILISTLVPAFQRYGTAGPKYYDFTKRALSEDDATSLLLQEGSLGSPPNDPAWKKLAIKITKSLGYLALAICHAGRAIRHGLCGLEDFEEFYYASWRSIANSENVSIDPEKQHEVCAVTTWEMLYRHLEARGTTATRDAIQLLNIFAFLHWENIPRELFTRAMRNSQLEAEQGEKDRLEAQIGSGWKHKTWSEWLSSKQLELLMFLASQGPSPLPPFIQYGRNPGNFDDADFRVRHALRELTDRSLIMYNSISKTYNMHIIVHRWARMRPGTGLGEQARWADAAGRVLSASILLPPLGLKTADETYHFNLLSHVEHVQKCRKAIADEVKVTRSLKWLSWLKLSRVAGSERLLMFGKFSIVYGQAGKYDKAEELLTVVNEALRQSLGPHHPRTRRITMFLSTILWKRSKPQEASDLGNQMLLDCERHYGRQHPETLCARRDLGSSLWQLGRFSDALELQREAHTGLRDRLGHNHPDTLKAADRLGVTVVKFYRRSDIEEAYDLHDAAVRGMEKLHGKEHHRTLEAKQNLSRVCLLRSRDDLAVADELMQEVLSAYERRLGESAPETLIAMINMAITKCALGFPGEGEDLMRRGLPIGEELYGSSHIAVLWGKSILAITLTHQGRFVEAQELLKLVAQTQRHMAARRGDHHPDRIATLIELSRCYHLQGKIRQSMEACEDALTALQAISRPGAVHVFTEQLQPVRDALAKCLEAEAADVLGSTTGADPPPIVFPSLHFLDSHLWETSRSADLISLTK